MVKLLGGRGASAVMGLFMLALGSSEVSAQSLPVNFDLKATKALDVDTSAKPLGTVTAKVVAPVANAVATRSVALANGSVVQAQPARSVTVSLAPASPAAPAASAAAAATTVQQALRADPALAKLIPAGWAPASMADLSNMLNSLVNAASTSTQPLDQELSCLATAVYFEARGEPIEGQLAVANVVINRASSGRYPPGWCAVVKQKAQFSFVRNGAFPTIDTNSYAWMRAQAVARIAASHVLTALPQDVLWYHANYVAPNWRRNLTEVEQIGAHIFYRS